MNRRIGLFLSAVFGLALFAATVVHAGAGDKVYTDPYAGFSILQPAGWALSTSNGTITITQDAQQLIGVMIVPARVNVTRSPREWIATFGQVIGDTLRNAGGSFKLDTPQIKGQEAAAQVTGSLDGLPMCGVLDVVCEPGFVTVRLLFAPTRQWDRFSSALVKVTKSFRRSTVIEMGQRAQGQATTNPYTPRPAMALMPYQGSNYSLAIPPGWRVFNEKAAGFDLVDPQGTAHINYAAAPALPGSFTPQSVAQQSLPNAYQNFRLLKTEPFPFPSWNAMIYEFTGVDVVLGRPVHGVAVVGTQTSYLGTSIQISVRSAVPERWDMLKGVLTQVQESVVQTNGDAGGVPLLMPRNNPCDSSSILSSGMNRSQATSRSSQQWSNAMLGTERVYSPTTGQQSTVYQSTWWGTGPQGPGYYRQAGNGVERLEVVR